MSRAPGSGDHQSTGEYPPVCDFCGCFIDQPNKQCPALDKGVCRP